MKLKLFFLMLLLFVALAFVIGQGGCQQYPKGTKITQTTDAAETGGAEAEQLKVETQSKEAKEVEQAKELCVQKCLEAEVAGINLEASPCLSDEIIPGWVCDAAHFQRQSIDDIPENQCQAYREGKAKHFVEVSPGCRVIKTF